MLQIILINFWVPFFLMVRIKYFAVHTTEVLQLTNVCHILLLSYFELTSQSRSKTVEEKMQKKSLVFNISSSVIFLKPSPGSAYWE